MNRFLAVDGGGSKLRAILFDEDFRVGGTGQSNGVNLNFTTEADARTNIKDCLDQVFSGSFGTPDVIDKAYVVFVGNLGLLLDDLAGRCKLRETVSMSEQEAGLMAGAFWESGLLALSGTGSDIFFIPGKNSPISNANQKRSPIVGGWGPIIGDHGSGVWIGLQAVQAAVSGLEGWGERTLMLDLIRRDWHLSDDWEMVGIIYRSPSPFRKVGSLTHIVAEAAYKGDPAAIRILTEAGRLMALQAKCLISRFEIPKRDFKMVCCGGAWKAHPIMFENFHAELAAAYPELPVRKPLFEHIMAGPAREMLNRAGGDAEKANKALAGLFPEYIVRW